jgi:hypothetical protein
VGAGLAVAVRIVDGLVVEDGGWIVGLAVDGGRIVDVDIVGRVVFVSCVHSGSVRFFYSFVGSFAGHCFVSFQAGAGCLYSSFVVGRFAGLCFVSFEGRVGRVGWGCHGVIVGRHGR